MKNYNESSLVKRNLIIKAYLTVFNTRKSHVIKWTVLQNSSQKVSANFERPKYCLPIHFSQGNQANNFLYIKVSF